MPVPVHEGGTRDASFIHRYWLPTTGVRVAVWEGFTGTGYPLGLSAMTVRCLPPEGREGGSVGGGAPGLFLPYTGTDYPPRVSAITGRCLPP